MDDRSELDGKFLVAMPGMLDPRFEESVVFMCAHSDDGAMGLIVNKRIPLEFSELLEQLNINPDEQVKDTPIYFGGPVEHGRGFILHSSEYSVAQSTLSVTDKVSLTGTLEILEDIAAGHGPQQHLLALGYAGWSPGQLEAEIQSNGWLVHDGDPSMIYSETPEVLWDESFKDLGIDRRLLSGDWGQA
ncbi:MAG: YqgE/AlgH family protein [Pseudomonadota bacterium]